MAADVSCCAQGMRCGNRGEWEVGDVVSLLFCVTHPGSQFLNPKGEWWWWGVGKKRGGGFVYMIDNVALGLCHLDPPPTDSTNSRGAKENIHLYSITQVTLIDTTRTKQPPAFHGLL